MTKKCHLRFLAREFRFVRIVRRLSSVIRRRFVATVMSLASIRLEESGNRTQDGEETSGNLEVLHCGARGRGGRGSGGRGG